MSAGDFDNTDRGAGWAIPGDVARATRRITANIDGKEFRGCLIRTGASSSGPSHNLWLQAVENRNETYCVAVFKKDGSTKKLAGGEITLLSGAQFWVSIFANTNENPKSPKIDLSFQRKDAEPQPGGDASGGDEGPDDDVPF
jgi:hypothetical protein